MPKTKDISAAAIFIPAIQDFVTVVGACVENIDGLSLLRLQCLTSEGTTILMNPDDLHCYFKRSGGVAPF